MKKAKLVLLGAALISIFSVISALTGDATVSASSMSGSKVLAQTSGGSFCCLSGDRDCGASNCSADGSVMY